MLGCRQIVLNKILVNLTRNACRFAPSCGNELFNFNCDWISVSCMHIFAGQISSGSAFKHEIEKGAQSNETGKLI